MYTIFINDIPIYLTDKIIKKDNINFYNYDKTNLKEVLKKLEESEFSRIYFYHADLKYLWSNFQDNFKIIEAAGGVVFNKKEELLWIYRNNKWDLPKGKIEKGEEIEEAAIREVQEECGISELNITKFIMCTYHIYWHNEEIILKPTYWYKMFSTATQKLIPQIEEGITKVKWISIQDSENILKKTYQNIQLLISTLQKNEIQ